MWVRTINYWAARRSKEPLRGGVGSAEYGWGRILWARRMKEKEEKENREREQKLKDEREKSTKSDASVRSMAWSVSTNSTNVTGASGSSGLEYPGGNGKKNKLLDWIIPGGAGMVVSSLSKVSTCLFFIYIYLNHNHFKDLF